MKIANRAVSFKAAGYDAFTHQQLSKKFTDKLLNDALNLVDKFQSPVIFHECIGGYCIDKLDSGGIKFFDVSSTGMKQYIIKKNGKYNDNLLRKICKAIDSLR